MYLFSLQLMKLLLVLFLVVSSTATEYEEYEEDQELLSEIFEQNSFELKRIDQLEDDYTQELEPLKENVRKKRLQITPHSEQGNHFPVFDFDTKPKTKRTTAAPVTTTTSDELPPIKKFTFRLLENTTTTEAPEAENLVETESEEIPEKSQKLEELPENSSQSIETEEDSEDVKKLNSPAKSQGLTDNSPEEVLQGKESTISHGLPRISPGYLQVRHKGVSHVVSKTELEPKYDKFTTPSPEVSTLPAFFTTPAPAYFNPLGPVYPGIHHGHVQVPHFKNFEYQPATYHSSIKYPEAPVPEPVPEPAPEPAPAAPVQAEELRVPEQPQVPVFETNHEEPAKEHAFAETLFPTTEPAIAKLVTQFTTPKPFVSSLGANGKVTPAPEAVGEGAVVSALPPMTPYVPPYGPTPVPHHGLPFGPHGFSTPAPHFDLAHPQPHYGPPSVALPEPGYGVPEPVHVFPDPAYGVPHHPEPGYGVPGPVHSLPDPGYGVPEPIHPVPVAGYGVPEPIHHPAPAAGYGVPEPIHPVPTAGYGVPEPIHHVSSLHPTPHHIAPHPEPGYGVPEPVLNDPAHPFHFEFSGLPDHPPHHEPAVHPIAPVVPVVPIASPRPSIFSTPSPIHVVTPTPVAGGHVVHHGTPTHLPGHPVPHGKKSSNLFLI